MTAIPFNPFVTYTDSSGNPLVGGKIYTYAAGTTTPLASYTDASGATPATNPIILDSNGRSPYGAIWGSGAYKFVLTTSADVVIQTDDDITAAFGSGDMTKAIYDAANISQQVVGTTAVQILTNKTLISPVLGFASNLTEYAEGTYTVALTCGTSGTITISAANDTASYIRVGNIVHVSGNVSAGSVSSPVGQLRISLPFPIADLSEASGYSCATLVLDNTVSANAGLNPTYLVEGTSYITGFTNSATALTNMLAYQIKAGTVISFQATYRTA